MAEESQASKSKLRQATIIVAGLCATLLVLVGAAEWRKSQQRQQWIQAIEATGAEVTNAGYGPTGPAARLPVIREFFITAQIEIFLPNSDVVRAVIPLLPGGPKVGRFWLHSVHVDEAAVELITKEYPEVQTIRYTRSGD